MAITSFGGGVSDMRGSVGGSTFTRTRAGAITRQRVKPTNPQSQYQMDQRSIITELAQAWGQTLTQAQRDGWSTFGDNFPSVNKLGQQVLLTGNQAFSRVGGRMLAAGQSYLSTAPADQDVAELQSVTATLDIGAGNFELAFTSVGNLGNDLLVIEMTPGISPGISNYTNRLRPVVYTAAAPTSPIDLESGFVARYGALPQAGQKVGIRAHFLRVLNGAVSSPLGTSGIVVST